MTPFSPRRTLLAAGLSLFAITASATSSYATTYTVTPFSIDHAVQTNPIAINASGTVVGNWQNVTGGYHSFSMTAAGQVTHIVPPNAANTLVAGINKAGTTVGSFVDTNGARHGFIDAAGTYTQIDVSGAIATGVSGINDSGTVVGTSIDDNGIITNFTYTNGTFTTLPTNSSYGPIAIGIDNAGDVAGYYEQAPAHEAAWRCVKGVVTQMHYPKGAFYSQAMGIARNGVVIGQVAFLNGDEAGFTYLPSGRVIVSQAPGSTDSFFIGINKAGTKVGASFNTARQGTAFIDQNGSYTNLTITGATETHGLAINDAGTVLGDYVDSAGTHGFIAVPSN
jgi:probable HAF family extracellular repeat protein